MGPLSVNLIAPSDGGKTQLMLQALPQNARVLNDVTVMVLMRLMREPKPPTYLVIPDLNIVIAHKPTVAELTMAMLLALMGEGISELNPGLDNAVKIQMGRAQKTGLRIALMTGMTPQMFFAKRGKWRATGLLRRLVPIYYTYTIRTQKRIQDSIQAGKDTLDYTHRPSRHLPKRHVNIPQRHEQLLRDLSEQVIEQLTWRAGDKREGRPFKIKAHEYPFSPHKVLRQLARSSAVLDKRDVVTDEDFARVEDIACFMRYDRPEEV